VLFRRAADQSLPRCRSKEAEAALNRQEEP
jgi:hypothetical protein